MEVLGVADASRAAGVRGWWGVRLLQKKRKKCRAVVAVQWQCGNSVWVQVQLCCVAEVASDVWCVVEREEELESTSLNGARRASQASAAMVRSRRRRVGDKDRGSALSGPPHQILGAHWRRRIDPPLRADNASRTKNLRDISYFTAYIASRNSGSRSYCC